MINHEFILRNTVALGVAAACFLDDQKNQKKGERRRPSVKQKAKARKAARTAINSRRRNWR